MNDTLIAGWKKAYGNKDYLYAVDFLGKLNYGQIAKLLENLSDDECMGVIAFLDGNDFGAVMTLVSEPKRTRLISMDNANVAAVE